MLFQREHRQQQFLCNNDDIPVPSRLKFSVADPDPGSGMGKKSGAGFGMNNPGHISESLEAIFWVKILKFLDADPGSGKEKICIRDPGTATLD